MTVAYVKDGKSKKLTKWEKQLLLLLTSRMNAVVHYSHLARHFLDTPDAENLQGIRIHLNRLREKLETDPRNPKIIKTLIGIGFIVATNPEN